MKGCLISGVMTGSGKTTFTLGLIAALRKRGLSVQPFKVGPDFIDPGLHQLAAGVPSHNLDGWMLPRSVNEWLFGHAGSGHDVAVVEGVMGLYDGFDGRAEAGSSAEMAKWLGLKVILVIDASALGRTAAAVIQGIKTFDPQVEIGGVIFNRVAGPGHFQLLADACQEVPVLGWLPADRSIEVPERHLGLLTAQEELPMKRIGSLGAFVETHIDIDRLLQSLPAVELPIRKGDDVDSPAAGPGKSSGRSIPGWAAVRVALAHDEAFSFYYQANRFALERAGAAIVEFSPIHDRELPAVDFLYIGGGYPELYREALSGNRSMRDSVRLFIESGKRFYAECGGLMYLSQTIDGLPMVGALPAAIEMTDRPVDFGYCDVTTRQKSILGPAGTVARGHQFHYSRLVPAQAAEPSDCLYQVRQRTREYSEGFVLPNGVASYVHLHFLSNLELARNMLESFE